MHRTAQGGAAGQPLPLRLRRVHRQTSRAAPRRPMRRRPATASTATRKLRLHHAGQPPSTGRGIAALLDGRCGAAADDVLDQARLLAARPGELIAPEPLPLRRRRSTARSAHGPAGRHSTQIRVRAPPLSTTWPTGTGAINDGRRALRQGPRRLRCRVGHARPAWARCTTRTPTAAAVHVCQVLDGDARPLEVFDAVADAVVTPTRTIEGEPAAQADRAGSSGT